MPLLSALLAASFVSCTEKISIEVIQDVGGAGSYQAINESTNDTLSFSGAITIPFLPERLKARNGDNIKLTFTPSEKYVGKYSFVTSYKIGENDAVEAQPEYSFTISGMDPAEYPVSMSAKSTEQQITSSAYFLLTVTE